MTDRPDKEVREALRELLLQLSGGNWLDDHGHKITDVLAYRVALQLMERKP